MKIKIVAITIPVEIGSFKYKKIGMYGIASKENNIAILRAKSFFLFVKYDVSIFTKMPKSPANTSYDNFT